MDQVVTILSTKREATIIRCRTCVGPRNETSKAFSSFIGEKRINVERLTTHRFPIAEADRAYQLISGDLQEPNLGVVLNYDPEADVLRKISLGAATPVRKSEQSIVVGVIGAGGYVPAMLLPHFKT